MKVVFQYLKPFAFILLLCVLLLFGQALSDLSLPNLMSDIVNIGLQKNGIDEPVPEQISEQGMELICLFMKEEERKRSKMFMKNRTALYPVFRSIVAESTRSLWTKRSDASELGEGLCGAGRTIPSRWRFVRHRQRGAVSAAALLAQCAATDGRGSVSCSFANR